MKWLLKMLLALSGRIMGPEEAEGGCLNVDGILRYLSYYWV